MSNKSTVQKLNCHLAHELKGNPDKKGDGIVVELSFFINFLVFLFACLIFIITFAPTNNKKLDKTRVFKDCEARESGVS